MGKNILLPGGSLKCRVEQGRTDSWPRKRGTSDTGFPADNQRGQKRCVLKRGFTFVCDIERRPEETDELLLYEFWAPQSADSL